MDATLTAPLVAPPAETNPSAAPPPPGGAPAGAAPLTVRVEGGAEVRGDGRTATVSATHRIELRCGSASIVLTPGKIVIDAPEVQVLGALAKIHC